MAAAQRCQTCNGRVWIERKPKETCPKCGGELIETEERRRAIKGGFVTQKECQSALNKVLSAVATRLLSVVRTDDIVARLGGDEFVIVAPNMSPPLATLFAERIVRSIADEPYVIEEVGPLRVGVSVGYVCVPDDACRDDDLLQKIDAALYEAKAVGKGTHRRYRAAEIPPQ